MIPYTTIPFLSAFFLVLVGILIAHLLGTRSRDAARVALEHLRSSNDDLHASLETQISEYVRQQQQLVATDRERDVLRGRLDQMQTLLMQREQEYRRQQRAASESAGAPRNRKRCRLIRPLLRREWNRAAPTHDRRATTVAERSPRNGNDGISRHSDWRRNGSGAVCRRRNVEWNCRND